MHVEIGQKLYFGQLPLSLDLDLFFSEVTIKRQLMVITLKQKETGGPFWRVAYISMYLDGRR